MSWRDEIYFFDTEVLPHDWLFCAMKRDGDKIMFHNDSVGLAQWLHDKDPFLCGFNCKHYDNYIIKAILAGAKPEEVKSVNDAIIIKGTQGWSIDMGYVKTPSTFDLMLDFPTRPSLKL